MLYDRAVWNPRDKNVVLNEMHAIAYTHAHTTNMHRFQCGINGFVNKEWKLRLKAHWFSFPKLSEKIRKHRIADSIVELNSVKVICQLIALGLISWTYKI